MFLHIGAQRLYLEIRPEMIVSSLKVPHIPAEELFRKTGFLFF